MCRPIPGNSVRPKATIDVKPLPGSKGVSTRKHVTLTRDSVGIVEGPVKTDPDFFLVLFEHGDATVRARMHHTELKGLET